MLGYPSPTTSRYVILAAALLASGLFVGNWVHTEVRGDQWLSTVVQCERQRAPQTDLESRLRAQREFETCTADAEHTRTVFALGGMAAATAAALAVLFLAPVVVRRRRQLRSPGPALSGAAERFDQLAHEVGVGGRVRPLVGTSRQRDAFSFGAPGRYVVALPPAAAVRWREPRLFDPLVRHELAHVSQRDVALAWLTRSIWYALAPILALPVITAVVDGDTSILGDYLWRTAVLGAVVALLSAALLRSREYVADLLAGRWQGDVAAVEAVVGTARPGPTTPWRRLLARHPTPTQRVAVLRAPGLLTRSGFMDGLTGAFLGGLTVPLLVGALSPWFSASGDATQGYLVASLLLGPVLGTSVGWAVWREVLFDRVTGDAYDVAPVALGVGLGLVAGQAVSLGQTATSITAGLANPAWLLVSAVAGMGVTILSAGLAQLWTDAAPSLPGQRACWIVALVVNSALFTALLWSTSLFQVAADGGGWALGRSELSLALTTWPMFWMVLGVGASAVLAIMLGRSAHAVPDWLVEGPDAAPWRAGDPRGLGLAALTGLLSGLVASAVIVGYRLTAGKAASDELTFERFLAYQWVVALAAAVAVAVLVAREPVRGPGLGSVAGIVAAFVGSVGVFGLNLALGAPFDLAFFLEQTLRPPVVMGWYVALVLAPFSLALSLLPHHSVRLPVVATATSVLTLMVGIGALAERDHLIAPATVDSPLLTQPLLPSGDAATAYLTEVVPRLTQGYVAVEETARQVIADPSMTDSARAAALEERVLPRISSLLSEWAAYSTQDELVSQTHTVALSALQTADLKYRTWAQALRSADQTGLARVVQLGRSESRLWEQWVQWQTVLASG